MRITLRVSGAPRGAARAPFRTGRDTRVRPLHALVSQHFDHASGPVGTWQDVVVLRRSESDSGRTRMADMNTGRGEQLSRHDMGNRRRLGFEELELMVAMMPCEGTLPASE